MLKTFYVQTYPNGKLSDLIEYAYEDYKRVELETPLPVGVLGGAWALEAGALVHHPEWDTTPPDVLKAEIETQGQMITDLELASIMQDMRIAELEAVTGGETNV